MSTVPATERLGPRSQLRARLGDRILLGLTTLGALITIALMVLIAYRIFRGPRRSEDHAARDAAPGER